MKRGTIFIIAVLFATSLSAGPQEDLANAFSATFRNPSKFKNSDRWNKAVESVKELATKTKDNALISGFSDLSGANTRLVKFYQIMTRDCLKPTELPISFGKIEKDATTAKAALEKETFILPGKRNARAILVELADYIGTAVRIGEKRIQECKELSLASAFSTTFGKSSKFEKFDEWNLAVGNATKLPDDTDDPKDNVLIKGSSDLSGANTRLVKFYQIMTRDCLKPTELPISFGKIEKDATTAKTALEKETFILPGKRNARAILVELADHIRKAAQLGEKRIQECKALSNAKLLQDLAKKGPSLEDAKNKNFVDETPLDNPDQMIHYFDRAFKESTQFAVADAVSFRGHIPKELEKTIIARANKLGELSDDSEEAKALKRNLGRVPTITIPRVPKERDKLIRNIATDVVISKTGICTTFAALAYTLLTEGGKKKDIRVEILSRRNTGGTAQRSTHLFTVIGRQDKSKVEDPRTWGANARIVDLWLGALGNPYVYKANSREYQGWLSNLKIVHSNIE